MKELDEGPHAASAAALSAMASDASAEDDTLDVARREPLLARWRRRLVTIPLWVAGAVVYSALLPISLAFAAVDDLARGKTRFPRVRCVLFFALYLLTELVGVVLAGVCFVRAGMPFTRPTRRLVERDAALQRWFTNTLFRGALRIYDMRFVVEGSDLAASGPFLLFVRHASKIDTVLSAVAIANPHRILLRYVMKHELLLDPCLDVVGNVLPNAFVRRGKESREAEVAAVRSLARNLGPADGVLIYPEGTCFEPHKLEESVKRIALMERPELAERARRFTCVLPPRLGGPLALLEATSGLDVVICAHTGLEAAIDFSSVLRGDLLGRTIDVRIARIPAGDVPKSPEERATWLFDRWLEIDAWVRATRAMRDAKEIP